MVALSAWSLVAALAAGAFARPAAVPPLGWSTWNTFKCNISGSLVREAIEALHSSPLAAAGYKYILIDDCWTKCARFNDTHFPGYCVEAGARDGAGRLQVGPKFPKGFKELTDLAHAKGLKIGIYTSVSAVTCAGYTGSLGHEEIDAQTFADWGFDFVKHDTCGTDYSVHDGTMQGAVRRMRDGLWNAGNASIVYYLDSGNPTSPQRVYNPRQHHVDTGSSISKEALHKLATSASELVWVWTRALENPERGPHLTKSWFDIKDTFASTLTNLHNQVRTAEWQSCGQYNFPGMLTVGQGAQTAGEYRIQFFTWAILGTPLILGNDIRRMTSETVALLTAPEILDVDQDMECVQGSLAHAAGSSETWIKPLSDGSFAVVLVNKGQEEADLAVYFDDFESSWSAEADFFPAMFPKASVRDLLRRKDLGAFEHSFSTKVPGHDAVILKILPVEAAMV